MNILEYFQQNTYLLELDSFLYRKKYLRFTNFLKEVRKNPQNWQQCAVNLFILIQ